MRADEEYMVSLWQHEITRVVKDRICRSVDIKWFEKTLKSVIKEVQLSIKSFYERGNTLQRVKPSSSVQHCDELLLNFVLAFFQSSNRFIREETHNRGSSLRLVFNIMC